MPSPSVSSPGFNVGGGVENERPAGPDETDAGVGDHQMIDDQRSGSEVQGTVAEIQDCGARGIGHEDIPTVHDQIALSAKGQVATVLADDEIRIDDRRPTYRG